MIAPLRIFIPAVALVAAVLCALCAPQASADSISINFAGNGGSSSNNAYQDPALIPDATSAGYVPSTTWNNLQVVSINNLNGSYGAGSIAAASGTTQTVVNFAAGTGSMNTSDQFLATDPYNSTTANAVLLNNFLQGTNSDPSTVAITGISSSAATSGYYVVLYVANAFSPPVSTGTTAGYMIGNTSADNGLTITDGMQLNLRAGDVGTTRDISGNIVSTNFIAASSTSSSVDPGNFFDTSIALALFHGTSLYVNVGSGTSGGFFAGLDGIQLISPGGSFLSSMDGPGVPEPSSVLLLGLGTAGLAAYRLKRRAGAKKA